MPQEPEAVRVLLLAEEANPEWFSVPLVGWSHSRALAKLTHAHVVTQVRNREAFLRAGLVEGRDFTAIDSEAVARRVHRAASLLRGGEGKGWTTVTALSSLSYYYFEHLVWRRFGPRIREGAFDLVHRLTPLSPTIPSRIASRCRRAGVPFVLGPLNGGIPWPRQFGDARRREREWLSYVRSAYRLLPGYRSTRACASALLIASRATFEQMPPRYRDRCYYVAENGIDPDRFSRVRAHRAERPIRAIFLGRLVPYKGPDILIEAALPLLRSGDLELEVVGEGPLKPMLIEQVRQAGVAARVRFSGWVDHAEVQGHLARADVLAFPSIREFGGAVVLEAMAVGVVPIVVDYGGPGEYVGPDEGYLVPLASRDAVVAGFRRRLEELAANPSEIEVRGRRARARVLERYTWDAKAKQVLEVYEWILGRRAERPESAMLPMHAA